MVRTLLVDELGRAGGQRITISQANSLASALVLFGGCDIILTDLHLGADGLDGGIELIRRASERHQPIPVVVLTGFTQSQSLWRAHAAGARGLIAKSEPLTGTQLLDVLRRVLQGGDYICPASRAMLQVADGTELTPRQCDVLALVATGKADEEIADALTLSIATVRTHLRAAYRTIGVTKRTAAMRWWLGNATPYTSAEVIGILSRIEELRRPVQQRTDLAGVIDGMVARIAASTGVGVAITVNAAAFDPPLELTSLPPQPFQQRAPAVCRPLEWGALILANAKIYGSSSRQPLIDLLLRVIVETLAEVRDVEQLIRDQQRHAAGELHNTLTSSLLALRLMAQQVSRQAGQHASALVTDATQLLAAVQQCEQTTESLIALWYGNTVTPDIAATVAADVERIRTLIGGPVLRRQEIRPPAGLTPMRARQVVSLLRGLIANVYEHARARHLDLIVRPDLCDPALLE
ncbi:MAG: response regulator transcription factor, partial [Chloroflexi bacterium]|nr:response regulator transcription factor [Chloroflexota bacterium]